MACEPLYAACAVIVARAGSKGLPRKNGRMLGGKPLLARAIQACKEAAPLVGMVAVSTEDENFAHIAEQFGAKVVWRPPELATDTARIDETVAHAVGELYPNQKPQVTLIVQPNIPIWEPGTVRLMVERLMKKDCTAVVTVVESRERPEWAQTFDWAGYLEPMMVCEGPRAVNRQQLPACFHLDGQVLAVWTETLMGDFPRTYLGCCGDKILPHVHEAVYGTDIDTPYDLEMAEHALKWLERK